MIKICPCGSNELFATCCGYYINSFNTDDPKFPCSAEKLMRARFTAYFIKNAQFLFKTIHPSKQTSDYYQDIENGFKKINFLRLNILHVDFPNFVTFCAYFVDRSAKDIAHNNEEYTMIECSYFVQMAVPHLNGVSRQWFYMDGQFPTKKQLCVCNSGKKFKHCCGKKV